MRTDIDHPDDDVRTARAVYDPGPSGTAVAGLIIGLIALAVALYAAFAPRETVRQGAQAVEASWQEATNEVPASQSQEQPAERTTQQPQGEANPQRPGIIERGSEEVSQQIDELKAELRELRNRMDRSEQSRAQEPVNQRTP